MDRKGVQKAAVAGEMTQLSAWIADDAAARTRQTLRSFGAVSSGVRSLRLTQHIVPDVDLLGGREARQPRVDVPVELPIGVVPMGMARRANP